MCMLRTIEIFLRESGMAPTRFGREAARDPRLVLDMRRGREPTPRMCRRLTHFIDGQRRRLAEMHAETAACAEMEMNPGIVGRTMQPFEGIRA